MIAFIRGKNSYKHELSGLSYLQDHFRKTFLPRIQIESYFQWLPRIIFLVTKHHITIIGNELISRLKGDFHVGSFVQGLCAIIRYVNNFYYH